MGNSVGSLDKHVRIFDEYPHVAGGFIWDFIDQTLRSCDENGNERWLYGGDFGDEPNSGSFLSNGILTADRKPHPHAYQVKQSYRPICAAPVELSSGKVAIRNKNWFAGTDHYLIRWMLTADGEVVEIGEVECPSIEPQGEGVVQIPLGWPVDSVLGKVYHLKLSYILRGDTKWAEAGFEVGWDQFEMPSLNFQRVSTPNEALPRIDLVEHDDQLRLVARRFEVVFDKQSGVLKSYNYAGRDYLTRPLVPNFWRVPIDNDGYALLDNLPFPKFIIPLLLPWLRWKSAAEKRRLVSFLSEQPSEGKAAIQTQFRIPGGKKPMSVNYEIQGDGTITCSCWFSPNRDLLRLGLQTGIPSDYRTITWFGRGPQESMLDRWSGYAMGIYSMDIEAFIHDYVRPQENGNRMDVHWLRLTDVEGHGLEIRSEGEHLLNFSVWPYTQADLEAATHIHELPRREEITLNLDYGQKGVGDLTSTFLGMPEDALMPKGKTYGFQFRIRGL
jgi:beta-galactosidase